MTADEYKTTLQSILSAHTPETLERLTAIKHSLPQKARQVTVGVHPGQGEEGFFDIVVHLEGPDLYGDRATFPQINTKSYDSRNVFAHVISKGILTFVAYRGDLTPCQVDDKQDR